MALPPGWSGVDLVGSAGPVDSCEPAVGTRGCPQPGLCGHLVRVHGLSGPTSWRRGALGQSGRPGVSRQVASSAPRGAAPSFPSRAPPRPWSPAWCLLCPGAKRGRGDKVALCHREGDRSGRGPGGLPGGGGLQRTGRLTRLKATLLQKCPPMCAVAPPWPAVQSWPGPCGPPGSVLTLGRPRRCRVPPPWPPGRACAWALRPPLFLSLLHPSPPGPS